MFKLIKAIKRKKHGTIILSRQNAKHAKRAAKGTHKIETICARCAQRTFWRRTQCAWRFGGSKQRIYTQRPRQRFFLKV